VDVGGAGCGLGGEAELADGEVGAAVAERWARKTRSRNRWCGKHQDQIII